MLQRDVDNYLHLSHLLRVERFIEQRQINFHSRLLRFSSALSPNEWNCAIRGILSVDFVVKERKYIPIQKYTDPAHNCCENWSIETRLSHG